jgi:hypothetical protein
MPHRTQCGCVILLAAFLFAGTGEVLAAGSTAKTGLGKATEIAKKWKGDAVLTSISSLEVQSDGTARTWLFMFYSPASKKYNIVTAKGTSFEDLEVNSGMSLPIVGEFLDSDKAVAEAKKNGMKGGGISVGLNMGGIGEDARLYWSVNGGFEKGDVSVTLDGKTGKFVKKDVMPGF